MAEDILVVEYEPRYTDRVRQALNGQPFTPLFAKDGEEALRALEARAPKLIVLSSVIPKISTSELIRLIRGRADHKTTPILVTVSGYTGKTPIADAVRLGASDILPKPYSDAEFLNKVQSMLNPEQAFPDGSPTVEVAKFNQATKAVVPPTMTGDQKKPVTSNDLFGDLIDGETAETMEIRKVKPRPASDDLDKMLSDTLSGVRIPGRKKTETTGKIPAMPEPVATPAAPAPPQPAAKPIAPATPPPRPAVKEPQPPAVEEPPFPEPEMTMPIPMVRPPDPPRPAPETRQKTSASAELDKLLENTLSGLERTIRVKSEPPAAPKTQAMPMPVVEAPRPAPVVTPPPKPPPPAVPPAEKVAISAPIFPPARDDAQKEDDEPGGIRFGHYALLEKIATGGMAEVWKARMRGVEGFQKIVAIKKILPHLSDNEEFVTMFVDEAKLAAQLNHNNIIHIYDLGKIANSYYIAMEYIDGHDLKTILKRGEERGQPMPVEIALFIASKIASALDYAHRKRDFNEQDMELVHRDVSPQNVLISHEGDIKLCDFGIAKAASKASHTQAGALKGKLQYMSPEQAWGRKIDRRSDIFALSDVLFEMLAGRKLFAGDSELSILEQVREARVTPPSEINEEVTPEIDAIVLKALQKNPDDRYQTAGEMAKDLDQILYQFRPTPTSADLAIYMHRIYSSAPLIPESMSAPAAPPTLVTPIPASMIAPMPDEQDDGTISIKPVDLPPTPLASGVVAVAPPTSFSFGVPEGQRKKFPVVAAAVAAFVAVAVAAGYFVFKPKSSVTTTAPAAKISSSSRPASAPPLPSTSAPAIATSATVAPATAAPVANDQAKIDQEVQRRLEAERLKLDQQKKQPPTTAAKPPETSRPSTTAVVPPQTQQAPPPQPVPATVAESRPAPPPVPVATQAPVQETPKSLVHEGDLVPPGVDGLVPPELVKRFSPPYPPLAQDRHVEGTVVVSALISETGKVIDVKIIKGVQLLNDAAIDSVKRSTFRPATKDGVRVKSYKTMTLPFKL